MCRYSLAQRMFDTFPSFIVAISQKKKKHTEGVKGHLSLFFQIKRMSDLNWSFCEEYTLTPRDTGDSLSSTF